MSEGSDDSTEDKTAPASEKRIQDAREKGDVPYSREAGVFGSLAAVAFAIGFLLPALVAKLGMAMAVAFDSAGATDLNNGADALAAFASVLEPVLLSLGLVLIVILAGGLLGAVAQGMPRFVPSRISPDLSRISVRKGLARLLGPDSLLELVKSVAKMGLYALIAILFLGGIVSPFTATMGYDPAAAGGAILNLAFKLAVCAAAIMAVVTFADVIWVRRRWHRRLMMTAKEVKDEFKENEANPAIKARLRKLARSKVKSRMLRDVPQATVVIANPTHYAVALRYVRGENAAPKVVAKGKDLVALRIRSLAETYQVPVHVDKSLARSLHDKVQVGANIPAAFYKAIAEVIVFISKHSARNP
jgi:flagellar biosynthetic protein FlhB